MDAAKLPFNLKIIPTSKEGVPIVGAYFSVMFNPENITISEDVEWDDEVAKGKAATDPKFQSIKGRRFTLEFTIDGTGTSTNGVKIPVTAQIALFRKVTTEMDLMQHRSRYLLVQYGTFISTCVLTSSSVTYSMFDMYGLPLRAKVTASFTERIVGALGDIMGKLSSPDLTHIIHVQKWDLLPLLTFRTYNNQNYYLQVAKVNKLKNFRNLEAGATLVFPPVVEKNSKY